MPLTLTPNEQQLLKEIDLLEHGVADYGTRMFRDTLVFHQETMYKWNANTKLWVALERNGVVQHHFAVQFLGEAKPLKEKLTLESARLSAVMNGLAKKEEVAKVQEQIDDIQSHLSNLKSCIKGMCEVNKQKAIWLNVEGQLVSSRKMDNYNDVLPLKGGRKICLRTWEISDRTSNDLWTYETKATSLDATEEEHKVVDWFFSNYAKNEEGKIDDEDFLPYLQEFIGYTITFESCAKCFFVIRGKSNTGKSHLFETLVELMGSRLGSAVPELFASGREEGHKTHFQCMDGKAMVYISELKKNAVINSDQVKRLTGDKAIPYRMCYGKTMRYLDPTGKIVVVTNYTLIFDGGDTGMTTRYVQIPFRYVHGRGHKGEYKERMRVLKSQGGRNAMMAWVLKGAKRIFDKIDQGIDILEQPEVVEQATKETVLDNDHFLTFIEATCEVWDKEKHKDVPRHSFTWPRSAARADYEAFIRSRPEHKVDKLNPTEFKERLLERYSNGKDVGAWIGIRPKPYLTLRCAE